MNYTNLAFWGWMYLRKFTLLELLHIYNPLISKIYLIRSTIISIVIFIVLSIILFINDIYFTNSLSLTIFIIALLTALYGFLIYIATLGTINIPVALSQFQMALDVEFEHDIKYATLQSNFPATYLTLCYGITLLLRIDPTKKHEIWKLLKDEINLEKDNY